MKAQFFIIASVIMIYVIILTFQYLRGFSEIKLTKVEEQQEFSYVQSIKDSLMRNFHASNYSSNGDLKKVIKDMNFSEKFFKQELIKKGIEFDSRFLIFSNGFESYLIDWTDDIGTPEVVNEEKYHGDFSLNCTGIEYVNKKLPGLSEVYVRVYINFYTLPSTGAHYFISLYDDSTGILKLGLHNDGFYNGKYNYMLRVRFEPSAQDFYSSVINIGDKDWHYFELYWYENSTDSKTKAWYDGSLEIDETIDSLSNGKSIDEYRIGLIGGSPPYGIYVDCTAISNEYIGEDCYPDGEPSFGFELKTKEMKIKTRFEYEELPIFFDGVLYLNFDEGSGIYTYDKSDYGNDGRLLPVDSEPQWVDGKFGKALDFDADNDYVRVAAHPSLNVYGKTAITVMAWIYPRSRGEYNYGRIVDKSNSTSDNRGVGYTFSLRDETGGAVHVFAIVKHGSAGSADDNAATYTNSRISLNNWHHVAFVYDGTTKNITMYTDGYPNTNIYRQGQNNVGDDSFLNLRVGNWVVDTNRTFDGIIDEVRIWDRALNETEIQVEMNKG